MRTFKGDWKKLLGATKRENGGFGSTGLGVIKKIKVNEEEKNEEEVNHHKCDDKCTLLQIAEKPKEDLQVVSEEAVMKAEGCYSWINNHWIVFF